MGTFTDKKDISLYFGDSMQMEWRKVDAIITDIPYGTTACKWDVVIPFDIMWEKIKGSLKPKGAFVTTASQPFTSALVMSNPKWFKYELIWDKMRGVGMSTSKIMPMKQHENIVVFGDGKILYNPQKTKRDKILDSTNWKFKKIHSENGNFSSEGKPGRIYIDKFPVSILSYHKDNAECNGTKRVHPTQKPIVLMEYLIKTYTNEGDTVLDFCMGSGSTGVAAKQLNRRFIGIEKEQKYYDLAVNRIMNETVWGNSLVGDVDK